MDGISSLTSLGYVPQLFGGATASSPTSAGTSTPTDSFSLTGQTPSTNLYAPPDPAFAALMQSDPTLAQDYTAVSQSVATSDQAAASSVSAPATSPNPPTPTTTPQLELAPLAVESSVVTALFGGSSDSSSMGSLFSGAAMTSMLSNNGAAAMAYLSPQTPATSGLNLAA